MFLLDYKHSPSYFTESARARGAFNQEMRVWVKKLKCVGKLPFSESDFMPQKHRVTSESICNTNTTKEWISCAKCITDNKPCKCNSTDNHMKNADGSCNQPMKATSSFFDAVVNMSGMLIGLGQLSTPYALQSGGWSSSALLIGLGTASAYSGHLLGKCLDRDSKSRSYVDIGEKALGRKGKILASTFIYTEIFMALVAYTISLHDNLNIVFTGTKIRVPLIHLPQSKILTVIAVLMAIPSLWLRDLSSISFLSTGGILMSLLIFMTVASTAIFGGLKANHSITALQLDKIPHASGLYAFSYAGHIVFPNIHKAMKEPSKFTKVVTVSFALVTLLYISLAFMGAKLFGPGVNPQITLSMPPHRVATKIALWATVLTPMTKYALEYTPFALEIEQKLPQMKSRTKMIIRGTIGSILLLTILALALTIPYFKCVLSLTGSLVSIGVAIILPCNFYIKIFQGEVSRPSFILNLTLITLGSLLGVSGTISSSRLLIKTVIRARHQK